MIQNWANEISRFCPTLTFRKIYGNMAERQQILSLESVANGSYDVYLTTYETVVCEEAFFSDSWTWASVTIDEGHRIKNENAVLRAALNRIRCPFRLLLTGTPLQNDLHELWALLNYVMPDVFSSSKVFDDAARLKEDHLNISTTKSARLLLEQTMMIRRIKCDVEKSLLPKIQCKIYVPMAPLQIKWYRQILERDLKVLSHLNHNQLLHMLSQLRKIANHPKQIYNNRKEEREKEQKRVSSHYYAGCEYANKVTKVCTNHIHVVYISCLLVYIMFFTYNILRLILKYINVYKLYTYYYSTMSILLGPKLGKPNKS